MNKLIVVCAAAVVAGCATTDRLRESDAKIRDLEKRIAKIEGDLYRVENKSAPQQMQQPKFIPAKEVEPNVIDTKIDAFMQEHLGCKFGDKIETYGGKDGATLEMEVVKKFKYFDKAKIRVMDGKLYSVEFYAAIPKTFSKDSTDEQSNQALADLAVTLGMASDAFLSCGRKGDGPRPTYSIRSISNSNRKSWIRGVVICDENRKRVFSAEKSVRENAAGEKLPDAK